MDFSKDLIQKLSKDSHRFLNLSKIENLETLENLRDVLRFHEHQYYVKDNPLISDYEYDTLYQLLVKTENEHPLWIDPASPSQRVSNDITDQFNSVSHLSPMLSLENSYELNDLEDFDSRIKKLCGLEESLELSFFAEPKFDGGSIALIYENDQLVRAATRGDGFQGEEITANARTIRSLPLAASFSNYGIQKVELRGEAVLSKQRFEQINNQRESDGLNLLANPRNAATGVLRVKDPSETANRGLDVFVFQLAYAVDQNGQDASRQFKTHLEWMEVLDILGFKIGLQDRKVCTGVKQLEEFINQWNDRRDQYVYEIDGVVVKLNDLILQDKCGFTAHHPRWAVAHKFQAKQATSNLLSVEFQIGKIGSITPVAKIEPVQLAGVKVSSVSLHNEDFIKQRDIRYGDRVLVERAGDVIPYIVKAFPELRTGKEQPILFPKNCPVCQTALVKEEDEAAWRCPNYNCSAQVLQRIIHHVSKEAMDIDGLGKSLVERFYELSWIKDFADIYSLNYEKIAELEGMGEKSASKLKQSIEKTKSQPIHRLLHGLCIHHVGKKVSKLIAQHLDYLPDLAQWNLEKFTSIKDVGPVVGQNIINFFSKQENLNLIKRLESCGLNMRQTDQDRPNQVNVDGAFYGKTILFTGTLSTLGRKEAQEMAEKAGAKNLSAVSSNLNILVAGSEAGSKLNKAKALGTVEILTEEEFLNRINEA